MKNSNIFSILIDNEDKVPSLVEEIRELGLIERSHKKEITTALLPVKSMLVFDKRSTYDYAITDSSSVVLDWWENILGKKTYKVGKDFETILDQLNLLTGKERKNKDNMIINVKISVPKKVEKKHKVRVFSTFVKVGWNQYSIKRDFFTDREYVIIKGNRYEVVRDVFGQGYLVEL
jgi:hypothetical protein